MQAFLPRRSIPRPTLTSSVALVVLWLGAVDLVAQADASEGRSGIVGTIQDRVTHRPIAGASLQLLDGTTGEPVTRTESDSLGAFAISSVEAGIYTLRIRGFGYQDISRDFELADRAELELTAALVPEAVDLDPIVVTVERREVGPMRDFERRRTRGIGSFITRDDIERRRPHRVSDLFRSMAGVRVVPDRYGEARLLLHGSCVPKLYIDGVASYEGTSLDLLLQPDDIEGIEIYTTATTPAQYSRMGGCGVLVVWTRVPRRTQGRTAWWKPLALLGGLVGLLTILR